jgi:hypothetical protein
MIQETQHLQTQADGSQAIRLKQSQRPSLCDLTVSHMPDESYHRETMVGPRLQDFLMATPHASKNFVDIACLLLGRKSQSKAILTSPEPFQVYDCSRFGVCAYEVNETLRLEEAHQLGYEPTLGLQEKSDGLGNFAH